MFRIEPNMPPGAYQTFQVSSPIQTHWRPATCAEAECPHYLSGWRTDIDETTDLGAAQAYYIRHDRSRRHVEDKLPDGRTSFTFEAGQPCFQASQHKVPLGRPELFVVRGGDWRGNPTGESYQHTSAESWLDQFACHQDKLAETIERG